MDQRLGRFAHHVDVGQNHLVDAVIVPFVMGRHLIDPFGHAGVGIAGHDRHRPFIVARPLMGVPGAGIAGAVIDQVQLGVVGIPAPGRAAADLPLVALPGGQGGVLADRLAEHRGLFGIEQDLVVRTDGRGLPYLLAVFQTVGGKPALDAEFAARYADEHLVLDDDRGRGHGLALARIAVLDAPHHLAGLGVERHDGRVGLVEDDLAVAIGHAAIDGVAAHHRDHVGILGRLIFPDDLALIVEVEGEHRVGERGMDVHDVAHHQRSAFMAAQHAGGEGPDRPEILYIAAIDLGERAVAVIGIITGGHHPLIGILRKLVQFLVRTRRTTRQRQCTDDIKKCTPRRRLSG